MFDAYFDASGHEADSPFVVVAGYVASIIQWKVFEHAWDATLKRYGITRGFHATDFMAIPKRAEFKKWEQGNPEAEQFLGELIACQQVYPVLSISCIVSMSDYNDVDRRYAIRNIFPPYALAARVCIAKASKWAEDHGIKELECIFEDGDFGQGKFLHVMREEGRPIIPKTEAKLKFGALQAADHLAWEQNQYRKREMRNPDLPIRGSFNSLLTMPQIHSHFPKDRLEEFCKAKGVQPRE
ncbi:MAG TPA: hypothetical protein VFK06_13915 [Candidatus Angelobacter sp.]|nr:hypothetical protein [Candidatus Angelobacter sp.]